MRFTGYGYYAHSLGTLATQIANWAEIAPLFFAPGQAGSTRTLHLHNGLSFRVRSAMDVWVVKETCLDNDYARHGTAVQQAWTVVDVGAGLGDFAVWAAWGGAGRVIAYEPYADSFALLAENIALNGMEARVTAVDAAVGAENGQLTLQRGGAAVQASTARPGTSTQTVAAVSLAGLMEIHQLDQIDFLKVDCEGGEYDIFLQTGAAVLDRIHHVCMEYHDGETAHTHHELIDFFRAHGFWVQTAVNPVHADLGFLYARRP